MTPKDITLARRIIACGLPVPKHFASADNVSVIATLSQSPHSNRYNPGDRGHCPKTRIMWQLVTAETGPELLPVLDDFALYGWLVQRLRAVYGRLSSTTPNGHEPAARLWSAYDAEGDEIASAETEVEALITALEAVKAAS